MLIWILLFLKLLVVPAWFLFLLAAIILGWVVWKIFNPWSNCVVEVDISDSFILEKPTHQILSLFIYKSSVSLILPNLIKLWAAVSNNFIFQTLLLICDIFHEYFSCHKSSKYFLNFGSSFHFSHILLLYVNSKH